MNPLHHTVELVRHAVFGLEPATDLWHAGALLLFSGLMWRLAVRRLEADSSTDHRGAYCEEHS